MKENAGMSPDDRFWIWFWVVLAFGIVAVAGIAAYWDYRSDLLQMQSPVVETCVNHRLGQKVTVSP